MLCQKPDWTGQFQLEVYVAEISLHAISISGHKLPGEIGVLDQWIPSLGEIMVGVVVPKKKAIFPWGCVAFGGVALGFHDMLNLEDIAFGSLTFSF